MIGYYWQLLMGKKRFFNGVFKLEPITTYYLRFVVKYCEYDSSVKETSVLTFFFFFFEKGVFYFVLDVLTKTWVLIQSTILCRNYLIPYQLVN